jgi:hypothetical protein
MEIKNNQAALILEADEKGEISVSVTSPDMNGLAGLICQAIATKLMQDEKFQTEILAMMEESENSGAA